MAQQTSELWKTLWQMKDTRREYQFNINGVVYGAESETTHNVDSGLYEQFGIGNAATAKLDLSLFSENIPRGATIKRFVRLANGGDASEWLPAGVFFTNKRSEDDGYWTVEAFDVMRKAEVVWQPRQTLKFPLPMPDAVNEFARIMGCQIDERTYLNQKYTIDYPANDYTIRQELCYIAAAHGGNWIVTGEGKLYLVPLLSIPPETNYLITEYGAPITLGGVKILV